MTKKRLGIQNHIINLLILMAKILRELLEARNVKDLLFKINQKKYHASNVVKFLTYHLLKNA